MSGFLRFKRGGWHSYSPFCVRIPAVQTGWVAQLFPGFLRFKRGGWHSYSRTVIPNGTVIAAQLLAQLLACESVSAKAGFGAEAFAEILNQIQPRLRTAIQSFQNRIELGRDLASLVLAKQSSQREATKVVYRGRCSLDPIGNQ